MDAAPEASGSPGAKTPEIPGQEPNRPTAKAPSEREHPVPAEDPGEAEAGAGDAPAAPERTAQQGAPEGPEDLGRRGSAPASDAAQEEANPGPGAGEREANRGADAGAFVMTRGAEQPRPGRELGDTSAPEDTPADDGPRRVGMAPGQARRIRMIAAGVLMAVVGVILVVRLATRSSVLVVGVYGIALILCGVVIELSRNGRTRLGSWLLVVGLAAAFGMDWFVLP